MAKQANQLEMAGMFKEAAEIYYRAAIRKPNKADYKTGLRRSGFMYVEQVSQEIAKSYARGEYQKVVYDYISIDEFITRARRAGVDISIDPNTSRFYENAKNQYLAEKYEIGLRMLSERRYGEAKNIFSEIVNINPDYRDSKANLNIAILEPIYLSGTSHFSQKSFMAAYNDWAKIVKVDPSYKDTPQRMQEAINERYKEGTILLIREDFVSAAAALGDVFSINPNYMEVKKLYIEAQNEPLYRYTLENLKTGRCREAYYTCLKMAEIAGTEYKDSGRLRMHALECASFPVAVLSRNMPVHAADGAEFENVLIQSILKKEDPFIKVHSLPSINNRIYRMFLSAGGNLDRNILRELHDRQGIKAILLVNYSNYERLQGSLKKTTKKGFYRQSVTNEQGLVSTSDKIVDYTEYSNNNKVSLNLNYQLISTFNGEILLSQRINASENSDINYAVFEGGELKNLYPAVLINDNYSLDERNYASLQKLLSAEKGLIPVLKLREKVFADLTGKISDALVKYNPER